MATSAGELKIRLDPGWALDVVFLHSNDRMESADERMFLLLNDEWKRLTHSNCTLIYVDSIYVDS